MPSSLLQDHDPAALLRKRTLLAMCFIVGDWSIVAFYEQIGQKDLLQVNHLRLEQRHLCFQPGKDIAPSRDGCLLLQFFAMQAAMMTARERLENKRLDIFQACRETEDTALLGQLEGDGGRVARLVIIERDTPCLVDGQRAMDGLENDLQIPFGGIIF